MLINSIDSKDKININFTYYLHKTQLIVTNSAVPVEKQHRGVKVRSPQEGAYSLVLNRKVLFYLPPLRNGQLFHNFIFSQKIKAVVHNLF